MSKTERWVFTDAELVANGKDCKSDDLFDTGPISYGPPENQRQTELGVLVQRNGTPTNRWSDGTVGIDVDMAELAMQESSLATTEEPIEMAENWRDVEVNDDGTLLRLTDTQ